MGVLNREAGELHARILYWGPSGVGLTTNLAYIHRKLRREHRGELRSSGAPGVPGASYEFLPVELGRIRELRTSIHIYTIPGGDDQRMRRRQLLEGADGIVFVADLRPARHAATFASLDELRRHLAAQGRKLDDLVLVVQYNRRDQADENSLDVLHRKLGVRPAATFEAVASEGSGVLQTLSCLSKLILKRLRDEAVPVAAGAALGTGAGAAPATGARTAPATGAHAAPALRAPVPAVRVEAPAPVPTVYAEDSQQFSAPLVVEPARLADESDPGLRISSAGPVEALGQELRIPLRLCEPGSGREIDFCLRLALDPS